MSWLKLSDDWGTHPKFSDLRTGALCQLIHARSLCYAGRYLTDGFLPASSLALFLTGFDCLALVNGMAGEDASDVDWPQEMIALGLWDAVEGGWRIHDYLTYNPSKKQVETQRKLKQRGGHNSQKSQHPERYAQRLPQSSPQGCLEQSPVPVPKKKEKETLNSRPPVLSHIEDREGKGFTSVSSVVEDVLKYAPTWKKEIP